MSEQLSIYDQGSSSILVPHLPESQMIGNAIQTLFSEQVENSSNVAYDAVPDQCNWNETGIKLFENILSKCLPINVISNFLTPSFSSPSKKRKFIIERPHGESLTSMDAIYIINQKEKTRNPPRLLQRKQQKPGKLQRNGITFMKVLQDGPKTLTKPTFETFDVEEASNDTNANVMPMISCHSNVPYIPSQMPYSTEIHAPYGYNQSLKDFYSYAQPPITCHRCNQEILNGSYAKCTTCIK
ncbi:unnamed protein product, partial [Rotaria magnacalcarata]